MSTVLLVCTGNICRSPIAEGLLRHRLAERGIQDISVESAGVSAWEESTASRHAVQALRELRIDISSHRARRLNRATIGTADLILGLSAEHHDAIVRLSSSAASRTFTLKEMIHLLRRAPSIPRDGDPGTRLEASVRAANELRASGVEGPTGHGAQDPLGLGLESFRATAWELEMLCDQFVELVFGDAHGGGGAGGRARAHERGTGRDGP